MRYDGPGDADLAREIAALVGGALETSRGWDHGLWVPLHVMLRDNPIPAVEISLPSGVPPRELLALGRALGPLRDSGVIVAGACALRARLVSCRRLRFSGAPPRRRGGGGAARGGGGAATRGSMRPSPALPPRFARCQSTLFPRAGRGTFKGSLSGRTITSRI